MYSCHQLNGMDIVSRLSPRSAGIEEHELASLAPTLADSSQSQEFLQESRMQDWASSMDYGSLKTIAGCVNAGDQPSAHLTSADWSRRAWHTNRRPCRPDDLGKQDVQQRNRQICPRSRSNEARNLLLHRKAAAGNSQARYRYTRSTDHGS